MNSILYLMHVKSIRIFQKVVYFNFTEKMDPKSIELSVMFCSAGSKHFLNLLSCKATIIELVMRDIVCMMLWLQITLSSLYTKKKIHLGTNIYMFR